MASGSPPELDVGLNKVKVGQSVACDNGRPGSDRQPRLREGYGRIMAGFIEVDKACHRRVERTEWMYGGHRRKGKKSAKTTVSEDCRAPVRALLESTDE